MAVFDDMGNLTLLYLGCSLEIHVDLERANTTEIQIFMRSVGRLIGSVERA